jgi:predicted NAD/FAD-dependent oxidoreductase
MKQQKIVHANLNKVSHYACMLKLLHFMAIVKAKYYLNMYVWMNDWGIGWLGVDICNKGI